MNSVGDIEKDAVVSLSPAKTKTSVQSSNRCYDRHLHGMSCARVREISRKERGRKLIRSSRRRAADERAIAALYK